MVVLPQPDSPTKPKVSPRADGEGDVGDGLDAADLALQQRPRGDRELLHQVLDLEQDRLGLEPLGPGPEVGDDGSVRADLGTEDDVSGRDRRLRGGRGVLLARAYRVEAGRQVGGVGPAGSRELGFFVPTFVPGEAAPLGEPTVPDGMGEIGRQPGMLRSRTDASWSNLGTEARRASE